MANNLAEGIAFQIAATRDKKGMTQADLAREIGTSQSNVARLESPDYGKQTITTLKRIAEVLDVALVVRLEPFSRYIDWLSGTPYLDSGLSPGSVAVQSFEEEEKERAFDKSWSFPPLDSPYTYQYVNASPPVFRSSSAKVINIDGYFTQQKSLPIAKVSVTR